MTRELAWRRLDAPGLEVYRIAAPAGPGGGGEATGTLLAREEAPGWFALRWRVAWDDAWRTRRAEVERLDGPRGGFVLDADGHGTWREDRGDGSGPAPRPDLAGCIDTDLAATPFTNTLPIRRLSPPPGSVVSLRVAYLDLPALVVRPLTQRYVRHPRTDGADGPDRWRYEDEAGAVIDGIATDAEGLVLTYPGIFERVAP